MAIWSSAHGIQHMSGCLRVESDLNIELERILSLFPLITLDSV